MQHTIKRLVRVFTPFMLLLLGMVLYYGIARSGQETGGPRLTVTPVATASESRDQAGVSSTITVTSQPVETAVAVATAVPTATLPAEILASLVGPPAQSIFPLNAAISFYWTSTYAPGENEVYGVFVANEGTEILAGTVEVANFGRQFQLRVQPTDLGLEPGSYTWDVRLIEEGNATARWQSSPRSFTIEDTAPTN